CLGRLLKDYLSMAEEVVLDLEELRQLQNIAKRPRVLNLISSEICNLEKLRESASVSNAKPEVEPAVPVPVSSSVKPVSPAANYATLGTFSWDQDNEKVKVYISLEGVDEDKVEAEFKPMSLDVKIHDLQGKNYRCAIPKLHKEIVPEKCKVLVKPKRIVVTMFKSSRGNWMDIHYKEDKIKPSLEKEKDPMAGIMDMMKNMYEGGDEEMKKAIAKAWTDARSGKAGDSLKDLNIQGDVLGAVSVISCSVNPHKSLPFSPALVAGAVSLSLVMDSSLSGPIPPSASLEMGSQPIDGNSAPLPSVVAAPALELVRNYASVFKSSSDLKELGTPTEHVSGALFVLIPDENIAAAKEEFKDYLFARFHSDVPPMGRIIGVINAVWAKSGPRIYVHSIGQGSFLLKECQCLFLSGLIPSGFSNGREVLIDVSYPWLPLKCDNCGKYGHKKEDCRVGAATTNHEGPPPKKNDKESSRRRSKSRPSRSRAIKFQEDDTNIVAKGPVTFQDVQCEAEGASLASHVSSDNDKIVDSKVEPESDGSLVAGEGGDDGLVTSETVTAGTIPCATGESSKSSHGVMGDVTIEPSEATMVEPAVCNVAENQEEEGEAKEGAENIELGQSISLGSKLRNLSS
ncbi:unnamed protein product, partial [Brassica oleracea]